MITNRVYLTKEGHKKLLKELEFLKTTRRRELSKAIAVARAHGDLSENAEYDAAKEAQAFNEKKIAGLEATLSQAQLIEEQAIPDNEVVISTTVTLKDLDSGEELVYTLVSEAEADIASGKISTASPVGQGLLNHKLHDKIELKVPAGVLKYKIIKISKAS